MSSDDSLTPTPEQNIGYVNARGTIYKVQGAPPLPVETAAAQRNKSFRQLGFMALRAGFSRRRHIDRLPADRQQALTTIREARKVSRQVIAQIGETALELTEDQARSLEQHLEGVGAKLLMLNDGKSEVVTDVTGVKVEVP